MSAPSAVRLKINPPVGRLLTLQFCRPAELQVDHNYQRDTANEASIALIRAIASNWNWDLCLPLVVARRAAVGGGEALYVIDGQHRLEAARLRGDIDQLPCVILGYGSAAEEAASFVRLNQQRRPLSKLDLFKAAVASGNPETAAIVEAMADAGLSVAPHNNWVSWKPGMVSNVGGIEASWRKYGAAVCSRAMVALARGFEGARLQYAGTLWPGIVAVCAEETRKADFAGFRGERFEQFVTLLRTKDQQGWRVEIARIRGTDPNLTFGVSSARALLSAWRKAAGGPPPLPRPAPAAAAPAPAPAAPAPRADPAPTPRPAAPSPAQRAPSPPKVIPAPAQVGRSAPPPSPGPKPPIGAAALTMRRFCEQCDQMVSPTAAAFCKSKFCKAKGPIA